MGQQESSYKKFDDRLRRRRRENTSKKEATKEEEEEVTTTTTSLVAEKEKVKAGFSLASLRWRPSLVVGSLNPPSDGDLSSWPGWYHGWCNKAQVRPGSALHSTPASLNEIGKLYFLSSTPIYRNRQTFLTLHSV